MLKILRKEIDFRHVYECARMVRKFSLNSGFGFMIGLPGETKEDRYMTLAVAIRVARDISENGYFIGPQVYRPYPGTPLYAECVRLGFHAPEKLEDWEKVVESNVGFLEADTLPWLDAAALSDIIFIQRYFSLALTQKWSGFRFLPFYVWPLFFLLQADRALRQSLGWYSGFVIEKHLLNLAEGARRRLEKLFKTKIRRRNAFQARPSRVPSSDDPVH
jgi:radical SAM superfamily enzyme YgiQ (UPF0313 family)